MPRPSFPTEQTPFRGFEPLSANFVYCPNQFFDVCLARCSRGTVRLVAYFLRRTLGWLDENGLPIEQQISITYQELVNRAGISRAAIRKAIDDAIDAGFIVCIRPGRADAHGQPALAACFKLRWDEENLYTTDPAKFKGFYAGAGNRSPIPNAFFDQVIPSETLAVTKVVGTVLRFTVGYENQFGRRKQAPLSYSFIQQYAKIGDRSTLAKAIRRSTEIEYIRCVDKGCFHKSSRKRKAATYAVKWHNQATLPYGGTKTRPAVSDRIKNQTSNSSQARPVKRFKNQTVEITNKKNTYKQQGVVENLESYELLVGEGITNNTAITLSEQATLDEIKQQITWIEFRNPNNRPAMLVRAIGERWSQPDAAQSHTQHERSQKRDQERRSKQAEDDKLRIERKRQRLRNKTLQVPIGESVV